MEYKPEKNDSRYRAIDLRKRDREIKVWDIPEKGTIRDDKMIYVLEIEDKDGNRRIEPDEGDKQNAEISISSGKITIQFSGERVDKERYLCLGHLYISHKSCPEMKYAFPIQIQIQDSMLYEVSIGENIEIDDIVIHSDEAFNSVFNLKVSNGGFYCGS